MIQIKDKKECCGCNACSQRCPKKCITLIEDNEGFMYPKIDTDLCIDCGICEKVCPIINQSSPKEPLKVYAAINPDEEIRKQSSSGGIFTMLAEQIINEGGVVFGAKFDENWEVKHDYTETVEGLALFRGSKYVQSRIEDNFLKAEKFLKEGRKVLFSGTPCQIAGLHRFLRKEYENLITVDFICHGVPSPKVWRMYLDETCKKIIEKGGKNSVSSTFTGGENKSYIEAISFRNKTLGWKKFSFFLKLNSGIIKGGKNTDGLCEPVFENIFMKGFLNDLYLRPSCYQCPSKNGKSNSDITIADFWGINKLYPEMDDDKGTSLILINSNFGIELYNSIDSTNKVVDFKTITTFNKGFKDFLPIPIKRKKFFKNINKKEICKLISNSLNLNLVEKLQRKILLILK